MQQHELSLSDDDVFYDNDSVRLSDDDEFFDDDLDLQAMALAVAILRKRRADRRKYPLPSPWTNRFALVACEVKPPMSWVFWWKVRLVSQLSDLGSFPALFEAFMRVKGLSVTIGKELEKTQLEQSHRKRLMTCSTVYPSSSWKRSKK
ncbi:hypothetical protein BC941DRAFT_448378 [Chlamydoabsidia padenii]|nr:hypothetical protein BC941DRAFT_448378 [Chlamydoabsidia padenii]